ncbi:hypothetical protein CVV68_20590 [Arthrobacter livingstonensis]|uniref:Uncharacterized protein n=1 Tax=Arthrobacter livingstonensis TaxID=670078 RepID=A0A2V5L3X5_9MICC|nr:hypothetical protein CVV68_20590 [Arthrobacter livingstonensis]
MVTFLGCLWPNQTPFIVTFFNWWRESAVFQGLDDFRLWLPKVGPPIVLFVEQNTAPGFIDSRGLVFLGWMMLAC